MNLAVMANDQKLWGHGTRRVVRTEIMGRAILAISGSAAALLPLTSLTNALAAFWHGLTRDAVRPYRPEQHYMRGPGPACQAKIGGRPQI